MSFGNLKYKLKCINNVLLPFKGLNKKYNLNLYYYNYLLILYRSFNSNLMPVSEKLAKCGRNNIVIFEYKYMNYFTKYE